MNVLLRKTSLLLLLIALVSSGLVPALAQSSRGTITGIVQDAAGALLPDADITRLSPSTGVSTAPKTNKAGIYRFEAVLAGHYPGGAPTRPGAPPSLRRTVTVGALVGRDF